METLLVVLAIQAANALVIVISQRALLYSNLALRQQLGIYKRKWQRPGLKNRDRLFWAWLSRVWPDWRSVLVIVQAKTNYNDHGNNKDGLARSRRLERRRTATEAEAS